VKTHIVLDELAFVFIVGRRSVTPTTIYRHFPFRVWLASKQFFDFHTYIKAHFSQKRQSCGQTCGQTCGQHTIYMT